MHTCQTVTHSGETMRFDVEVLNPYRENQVQGWFVVDIYHKPTKNSRYVASTQESMNHHVIAEGVAFLSGNVVSFHSSLFGKFQNVFGDFFLDILLGSPSYSQCRRSARANGDYFARIQVGLIKEY